MVNYRIQGRFSHQFPVNSLHCEHKGHLWAYHLCVIRVRQNWATEPNIYISYVSCFHCFCDEDKLAQMEIYVLKYFFISASTWYLHLDSVCHYAGGTETWPLTPRIIVIVPADFSLMWLTSVIRYSPRGGGSAWYVSVFGFSKAFAPLLASISHCLNFNDDLSKYEFYSVSAAPWILICWCCQFQSLHFT